MSSAKGAVEIPQNGKLMSGRRLDFLFNVFLQAGEEGCVVMAVAGRGACIYGGVDGQEGNMSFSGGEE